MCCLTSANNKTFLHFYSYTKEMQWTRPQTFLIEYLFFCVNVGLSVWVGGFVYVCALYLKGTQTALECLAQGSRIRLVLCSALFICKGKNPSTEKLDHLLRMVNTTETLWKDRDAMLKVKRYENSIWPDSSCWWSVQRFMYWSCIDRNIEILDWPFQQLREIV